jgi:hypothetical protein
MNKKNILIVFLLLFGCKENPTMNQQSVEYTFFPAAVGNQWLYVDSMNSTVNTTITKIISSNVDSNGFLWWNIENQSFATGFLGDKVVIRNDSIFSLQFTRGGPSYLGLLLVPPRDTTFTFYRDGGDVGFEIRVTRGQETYQIPAGSFNNWASYVFSSVLETDSIIVAPKIGILSRTFTGIEYPGRPAFRHYSILLNYTFK